MGWIQPELFATEDRGPGIPPSEVEVPAVAALAAPAARSAVPLNIAPVSSIDAAPGEQKTLCEGAIPLTEDDRPQAESVRGRCPECGDDLVSNLYYVGGRGWLIRWECWSSLRENPTCEFYKVL